MNDLISSTLGRTGLKVGRLGVASSYGAPAEAFEEAFEKGCNYFYIGSGRHRAGMIRAIRNICAKGHRDKLVIAIHTYSRFGMFTEFTFKRMLHSLGIDYADVLILGWHNRPPTERLMNRAASMKEKGLFKFLGMSGHKRPIFPKMSESGLFDLFHIRYNAAHRGAEEEAFPLLSGDNSPGIVTYTATRWGHFLNPKKMPPGMSTPAPSDCYRFVISNPSVNVCLCGPRNAGEMKEALKTLERGPLEEEEMERMRTIGDHIHQTGKGLYGL